MFKTKAIIVSAIALVLGFGTFVIFNRGGGELQAAAAALKPELILYSLPNFEGEEIHLYEDAADLPYEDLPDGTQILWNDNVGSIIVVSGTWRLFQNGRMNTQLDDTPIAALDIGTKTVAQGWSSVVSGTTTGALKIASPELLGIGSDISSVQLVSTLNLPDWLYGN